VEVDLALARHAQTHLHHVAKGATQAMVTQPVAWFSGVWLAPPIMRFEATPPYRERDKAWHAVEGWINWAHKALRMRGILAALLPEPMMTLDAIENAILARFRPLRAWRVPPMLTGKDHPMVLLIGQKRGMTSVGTGMKTAWRELWDAASPAYAPMLAKPTPTDERFVPAPAKSNPILWRGSILDSSDIKPLLSAMRRPETYVPVAPPVPSYTEAPLPLRHGHLAVLLSSGAIDGLVGSGPNRHLVRGKTVKEQVEIEVFENGRMVKKQTTMYHVHAQTLDANGTLRIWRTTEKPAERAEGGNA